MALASISFATLTADLAKDVVRRSVLDIVLTVNAEISFLESVSWQIEDITSTTLSGDFY